jgi:uncharacterized protein (TIGR03000 family)
MSRRGIGVAGAALASLLALLSAARAGGIGNAMIYGPYTGGFSYSYATAYGYWLPFNSSGFSSPWMYPTDWTSIPYRGYAYPGRPLGSHFCARPEVVPPYTGELPPDGPVVGDPKPAVVLVQVPAGAELWFDGNHTQQAGGERVFYSPPLQPGHAFHYVVRARWPQDGKAVEQFQMVTVQAGQKARVQFPQQ